MTEKPDTNIAGIDALRHAAWLAKSNAITVLPAVSSLKALREYARASHATKVFMGIGNPLLLGPQGIDRRAWEKQSCPRIINKRIAVAETSG